MPGARGVRPAGGPGEASQAGAVKIQAGRAYRARNLVRGASQHEGNRPTQEDRCGLIDFRTADGMDALLALVADGIGGHNTGEMASNLAKDTLERHLLATPPSASEIPQALSAAFHEANESVYNEALQDPRRAGMGTTGIAAVIVGNRLYLAYVGDSRAYVVRGNHIQQLSRDHTWGEEALEAGRSPNEVRTHPNRGVITRYLGITFEVQVQHALLADGLGSRGGAGGLGGTAFPAPAGRHGAPVQRRHP